MTENNTGFCRKCKKEIGTGDEFCRHCAARQRVNKSGGLFFSHSGIWVMFLLAGPLNLWFIWKSPILSRAWKIFYTFFFTFLTIAICWVIYIMIMKIINLYSTFFNMTM